MGEFNFINSMLKRVKNFGSVATGIGDDCAIISSGPSSLVTCDMLMDGSHFLLDQMDLKEIGRKILSVSVSDIAAMGGIPETAFLSLAIPKTMTSDILNEMMIGLLDLANEFSISLAGGDTNVWDGKFVANITLLGRPSCHGAILRSGARAGDQVFVTGKLGNSFKTGRHLTFQPRIKEALFLAKYYHPGAMIDISDGLASDLNHILKQSGTGAVLDFDSIPVHESLDALVPDLRIKRALTDGEDFELCFTLDPSRAKVLIEDPDRFFSVWNVGKVTEKLGLFGGFDGEVELIDWKGYEHGVNTVR